MSATKTLNRLHIDWSGIGETTFNGNNSTPSVLVNKSNYSEIADLSPSSTSLSASALPTSNNVTKGSSVTEEASEKKSKWKFLCNTCARKLTDATVCCCYEDTMKLKESAPSKHMLTFCEQHKSLWKVSKSSILNHHLLETGTEVTNEIENHLVAFFKTFKKEKLKDMKIKAHVKSPWLLRASDMTSPQSIYECFEMAPTMFPAQKEGAAAIGTILHEFVALGCDGELGKSWSNARSKSIIVDPEHLNIRVHGSSDAVFKETPVELKTITDLDAASGKIRIWLKQISLYQILNGFSKAILVIISRDTLELKAYEVSQENIQVSIDYWRQIFSSHPILMECLNISRVYAEHCEVLKQNPDKIRRDNSFLKVQEQGVALFLKHADEAITKFNFLTADKMNIDVEACINTITELKRAITILVSAKSLQQQKFGANFNAKLKLYSNSLNKMKKEGLEICKLLYSRSEMAETDSEDKLQQFFDDAWKLFQFCESPNKSEKKDSTTERFNKLLSVKTRVKEPILVKENNLGGGFHQYVANDDSSDSSSTDDDDDDVDDSDSHKMP